MTLDNYVNRMATDLQDTELVIRIQGGDLTDKDHFSWTPKIGTIHLPVFW